MKTNHTLRISRDGLPGGPRDGGVLALAMIVVLTIAALAAGMLQLSGAVTKRQASAVNTKLSFYMAESGLSEAYAGLVAGRTGNVGSELAPVAFGEGLFWVVATENVDGTTTLQSTGRVGNGRAVLSFVVDRETSSVGSLGFFGADNLVIGPGVSIDAFDSQAVEVEEEQGLLGELLPLGERDPAPEAPSTLGRLASNGSVTIQGTEAAPVTIDGNVSSGPSGTVEVRGAVTISGTTGTSMAAVELPAVEVPAHTLEPAVTVQSPTPYTILPGQTALDSLIVEGDSEVIVEGPVTLVLGTLHVKPGAQVTFDSTNGEISVYVLNNLKLEAGSQVMTTAEDAGSVSVQVPGATARPILLAATSEFKGVIYAPEASVRVLEPFEVYGSLVGNTLEFVGAVQMHYDVYLDALAAELGLPTIVSWRILELSNPSLAVQMDPFTAMGLDRNALSKPSDGHKDQTISIRYKLSNGTDQGYTGLESLFEWSVVDKVTSLTRDGVEVDVDAAEQREYTKIIDKLLP